jgi:predicted SAM-dependent methyltransferase
VNVRINIKRFLKRSGFIVGMVRAGRSGVNDIKKFAGFTTRAPKIRSYLRHNRIRKLQIGTSNSPIVGWLNTDLLPTSRKIVYLDATRRFPFDNGIFDYVYSEHMIEHVDHESAVIMLQECFRVLKPAGTIRISTPDLEAYIGLYSNEKTSRQKFYIDWVTERLMPEVDYCKEVFIINNAFRAWGHQFLYDRETLRVILARVGFEDIKYYPPGVSDDENLRGIESHGSVIGCEEINQFEAFAAEARVPDRAKRNLET